MKSKSATGGNVSFENVEKHKYPETAVRNKTDSTEKVRIYWKFLILLFAETVIPFTF
jgi:hypothetical protein